MIWLLWIGVIATFFRTTFCKAMLLNVALDRQGESFDFIRFFFSEHDRHLRVVIFGIWLKVFSNCFKILSLAEERLWKPGKSSVWSSVFGVCRVGDEKNWFRLSHGEDSWMMFSQLPNNAVLFSVFKRHDPRPCSVYVGMLKGSFNIWMLKNKQPEKKGRPVVIHVPFFSGNFHDIQFFSCELPGWWHSARVSRVQVTYALVVLYSVSFAAGSTAYWEGVYCCRLQVGQFIPRSSDWEQVEGTQNSNTWGNWR